VVVLIGSPGVRQRRHNGDAVSHVTHPTWRQDRYDPAAATRANGVKAR